MLNSAEEKIFRSGAHYCNVSARFSQPAANCSNFATIECLTFCFKFFVNLMGIVRFGAKTTLSSLFL